jgi:RNA polymerase sigma factor (sigma-70 family)
MSSETQRYDIAEFFRREQSKLVNYVRQLIDDAADRDGEDIVQDVALNLFSKADVTVPIAHLAAYVYQALRNRVVDLLRKGQESPVALETRLSANSRLSLAEVLDDTRYNAARDMEQQEIRQRLFEAIEALRPEQKAVIIETEFEGRSFNELAEQWGIPLGTLLARKSRGLKYLRATLADLKQGG